MFIDYVPLMLINMAAGLVVLAGYVGWGLGEENQDRWPVAFGMTGLIALVTGLHMIFTWPLPQMYNITHGELSVLFGIVFFGAGVAIARRWNLLWIAVYAFFAGLASVVIGIRVLHLGLTQNHLLSGIGYILTGTAGIFALPTLALRRSRSWRTIAVMVLLATAGIWALVGYGAYWDHLSRMKSWVPQTLRTTATAPAK